MEWNFDMDAAPKDRDVLLWLREPYSRMMTARWFEPWCVWHSTDAGEVDLSRDDMFGVGSAVPLAWMIPDRPKGA